MYGEFYQGIVLVIELHFQDDKMIFYEYFFSLFKSYGTFYAESIFTIEAEMLPKVCATIFNVEDFFFFFYPSLLFKSL